MDTSDEPWYSFFSSFGGILLITNAVVGMLCFEWAWSKTHRFRTPNKDLNSIFSMFERNDAKYWARWKFYPGVITLLIPRMIIAILVPTIATIFVNILLIGHNKDLPFPNGCRKSMLRATYFIAIYL